MLKTRVLVIISVGISVGFLLGMGVSALLRAMIAGGDRGLEITFTALVVFMAGILITYGLKFSPDNGPPEHPREEIHLNGLEFSPKSEAMEEPGNEVHLNESQSLDYASTGESNNPGSG